jgi:adsorption protein B
MPSAGVGCVFRRDMLARMVDEGGAGGPFSVESLTEDYELGLRVSEVGGRSRFLRVRGAEDGQLVATRAYFPPRLDQSVRQKGRWVHGIALQGWDRMGWGGGPGEFWMRLRDRRGLLSALVLLAGYLLLTVASISMLLSLFGLERQWALDPLLLALLYANMISFAWRAIVRFGFTAREHGTYEGLRAVLRIPVANVIAIMAAWRALGAYVRTLAGSPVRWEKTEHSAHPARANIQVELKAAA